MSCQPGRHAVVTVCEPDWKHKWAAYKSFDETSSFNNEATQGSRYKYNSISPTGSCGACCIIALFILIWIIVLKYGVTVLKHICKP